MKVSELEVQMENMTKQEEESYIFSCFTSSFPQNAPLERLHPEHGVPVLVGDLLELQLLWGSVQRRGKWSSAAVKYLSSPSCQMILQLLT